MTINNAINAIKPNVSNKVGKLLTNSLINHISNASPKRLESMASRYLINVLIGYCFKLIMCKYTNLIPKKEKKEKKMLIPYYIIEKKKGL